MKSLIAALLALTGAVTVAKDWDADVAAIVRLHGLERQGHLTGSADLVTATLADRLTVVENGEVHIMSRNDVHRTFVDYLKSVRYSAWEDVTAPDVHVARDGFTAWAVIRIHAKTSDVGDNKSKEEHEFLSSWIAVYEKQKGQWRMVAISSGCNPPCGLPESRRAATVWFGTITTGHI